MQKGVAINTKTYYFGPSGHALVQGFHTGSCCLLFGLGCKITPLADLLSVVMERATREMRAEGGEAGR